MTRLARHLVGRDAELRTLERLLHEVGPGEASFLILAGEPGIGKTTLLAELGRRGGDEGFLVLEGRGSEFERGLPYSVLIDAFDAYLQSLDARTLDRVVGDGLAEVASVFPSLREHAEGPRRGPDTGERFQTQHALRALIERLAVRQPLLLALDDLHWADDASLQFTAHLLRRRPAGPVLIAGALRTGHAPHVLATAVEVARRDSGLEQISLHALEPADADLLLEHLDPRERRQIYRESGGNPFYLVELGQAGAGARDGASSGGVPGGVIAAIERELAALSETGRTLIEAASVAGDPFEIDLAGEVACLSGETEIAALDELVARGLVGTTDVPRRFRFRHPLVRKAVYERVPPGSRLAAHGRAAGALAAQGASAAARAHHVEAAARPGDLEAVALLEEAGSEVQRLDPAAAARWYEAALRLLPGDDLDARLSLMERRAASLAAAGQLGEARTATLETLQLLPSDAQERRLALSVACATTEIVTGGTSAAVERLRWVWREAPTADERAEALVAMSVAEYYNGNFRAHAEWAERAVAEAEADVIVAAARAMLCHAHVIDGRIPAAVAERDRTAALIDGLSDEQLSQRLDAPLDLGASELFLDRLDDGIAHLERGIDVARRLRQGTFMPLLTTFAAGAAEAGGRLAIASELAHDAEAAARLSGDPLGLVWALNWAALVALARDDLKAALAAGEEGLEIANGLEGPTMRAWLATALARVVLEIGRPDRAREIILEHGGGPELERIPAFYRAAAFELLTRAALDAGDGREAADRATAAESAAAAVALPLATGEASRARAEVLVSCGDNEAAAEVAQAGAERAEGVGAPVEAAETRLIACRALAAAGERDAAVAMLEQIEDICAERGAELLRKKATGELRRLGRGRHTRSRRGRAEAAGLEGLSEREREIAVLVRQRHTNPEIAATLFLSPKTVESHLRNIFRKLDVSSRVEVAQLVESDERRSR
jgi:DNA-binding CsgD family transcriptional regulator